MTEFGGLVMAMCGACGVAAALYLVIYMTQWVLDWKHTRQDRSR